MSILYYIYLFMFQFAMKGFRVFVPLLMALMLSVSSMPVRAQSKFRYDSTWSKWNVRLAPYVWLLGIRGDIVYPPKPVNLPGYPPLPEHPMEVDKYEIDLGFKDVRNSLKFAFMLSGQYRKEWFITQFNISSFILESEAITPLDYVLQNNILNLAYAGGDFGFGYRIIRNPKLEFDALLGVKFVYTRLRIATDILGNKHLEGARKLFWADPVLASNLVYRPIPRLELVLYGDIGSTLLNSDLTYQFSGNINFILSKLIYLSAGYRTYYAEIPEDRAVFWGTLSGMVVRFGFQF